MTSPRKRKAAIIRRLLEKNLSRSLEDQLWDSFPPVGREFGSPDFDRLMKEDHPNGVGAVSARRVGFLKGKLVVPANFDAPLPDDVHADFEGGPEPDAPKDRPQQTRTPPP